MLTRSFCSLSSLRLIQPQINVTNAAYAALSFEHKALKDAREKVRGIACLIDYIQETDTLFLGRLR